MSNENKAVLTPEDFKVIGFALSLASFITSRGGPAQEKIKKLQEKIEKLTGLEFHFEEMN